jgi:hypothetical protein
MNRFASILLVTALAGTPAASASAAPTVTTIRIGDHPGFVRVVVDFRGGVVRARGESVTATDPGPFGDGRALLDVDGASVRAEGLRARAAGVSVHVVRRAGGAAIRIVNARHRFKDLSYSSLRRPERLIVDLWKSAPPVAAAEIRRAPDGCLALDGLAVTGRTVTAAGSERELFEHALVVRVRAADGSILAQRPVTAAAARWSARLRYPAVRRQAGTLEALATSAKDGALVCLVQVRVRLGS